MTALFQPRFVVLDTSTLAKISKDYWSAKSTDREKAHSFVQRMRNDGNFITLAFTHLCELLQHQDRHEVDNRLRFIRSLPLAARLRPYDDAPLPGAVTDILQHELHAVVHKGIQGHNAIVETVRENIWAFGVGPAVSDNDEEVLFLVHEFAQSQRDRQQYIASIARTDPGNVTNLTLGELRRLPRRLKHERRDFARKFAAVQNYLLTTHGDKRLQTEGATKAFVQDIMHRMWQIDAKGGDPVDIILKNARVPPELINDKLSVAEIGEFAVYGDRLNLLGSCLNPSAELSPCDVPLDTLPSYVIERRLLGLQRRAQRVSGSDIGDGHLVALTLYSDAVEVDKRTHEYLTQLRRRCPQIAQLIGRFFKSSDYSEIPEQCRVALSATI